MNLILAVCEKPVGMSWGLDFFLFTVFFIHSPKMYQGVLLRKPFSILPCYFCVHCALRCTVRKVAKIVFYKCSV